MNVSNHIVYKSQFFGQISQMYSEFHRDQFKVNIRKIYVKILKVLIKSLFCSINFE